MNEEELKEIWKKQDGSPSCAIRHCQPTNPYMQGIRRNLDKCQRT